jgi:hypothetical protein
MCGPIWVYLPPAYDSDPERRFPTVYVIQGYTGHVGCVGEPRDHSDSRMSKTADMLFAREDVPGCVMVYVDAWTGVRWLAVRRLRRAPATTTPICVTTLSRRVDANYRTIPTVARAPSPASHRVASER